MESIKNTKEGALAPDWSAARRYYAASNEAGYCFIVANICLGWEFSNLKVKLGFKWGGDRRSSHQAGDSKSWADFLKEELGISDRTADRYIKVYDKFYEATTSQARKKISEKEADLLKALAEPPDSLSSKQREDVEAAIRRVAGNSKQNEILEGLFMNEASEKKPAKPTRTNEEFQFEFLFGDYQTIHKEVGGLAKRIRLCRETDLYEAALCQLPIRSSDRHELSLEALKEILAEAIDGDLPAMLKDVKNAIKVKQGIVKEALRKAEAELG